MFKVCLVGMQCTKYFFSDGIMVGYLLNNAQALVDRLLQQEQRGRPGRPEIRSLQDVITTG